MRYLIGFLFLGALTFSVAGCESEPEAVPAKADPEVVKSGVEEEVERQDETMEGHGETGVDVEKQAETTAGVAGDSE